MTEQFTVWHLHISVFDKNSERNIAISTRNFDTLIAPSSVTAEDREALRVILDDAARHVQAVIERKERNAT